MTAQTTMRISDIALPEGVSAVVHGNEDPVVVSVVAQVEEKKILTLRPMLLQLLLLLLLTLRASAEAK